MTLSRQHFEVRKTDYEIIIDLFAKPSYSGLLGLSGCLVPACVFLFETPKAENSLKANPAKYVWGEKLAGFKWWHLECFTVAGNKRDNFFFFVLQESLFWATKLFQVSAGNHSQQHALLLEPPHLLL